MKRSIAFDTETTGLLLPSSADLKSQPHIIELAVILLEKPESEHLPVMRVEQVWLLNPGMPLSDEITKITGLKDADLEGKPTFSEILPELAALFVGVEQLISHNLPFDLGMLVTELRRCGKEHAFPFPPSQLCTVSAYAHLRGHNLKLTELYQHVLGQELKQTHRALDDARALVEIVLKEQLL